MFAAPPVILASVFVGFLAAAFVFVSLFMMLVVLIQKPKGGGLSGAFGGAGGGETSFVGARIGDFLTWLTVGCFVAFLLLAMLLTWNINPAENAIKAARTAPISGTAPGAAGASDRVESDTLDTDPPAAPDAGDTTPAAGDAPAGDNAAGMDTSAPAFDLGGLSEPSSTNPAAPPAE